MSTFRYAAAVLENFEIWNVRRDVLISDDKLLEQTTESSPELPVPPTLPPPPPLPTTDTSVSNDDGTIHTGRPISQLVDTLMKKNSN